MRIEVPDGLDSARVAYRLERLQEEMRRLDSLNAAYDAALDSTTGNDSGN